MKRLLAIILIASFFIFTLSSCAAISALILFDSIAYEDKVVNSLGKYKNYDYYTEGAFQDFTDYAKYYYDSVDMTDNEYFSKIQSSDIKNLNKHLDDFEDWIDTYRKADDLREIAVNYDFDRSLIDNNDYLYIETEWFDPWNDGNLQFSSYDVYFFDSQSNTLYYFHNNI